MRAPLLIASSALLIASSASAVTMDWTFVGNPGNPPDTEVMQDGTTGYGSVGYSYYVGTYEVTNAQYAEFLNAKDPGGSISYYDQRMATAGIFQEGEFGFFTYSVLPGRENVPVSFINFYSAIGFANWMNNGQGDADTLTGAYTITADGFLNNTITRNSGAMVFVPSEDEWYKAAYYDPISGSFFDYPAGSNAQISCSAPTPNANSANCTGGAGDFTVVGSYAGSASPYGTYDQGGNVEEWNEAIIDSLRGLRGGWTNSYSESLAASTRGGADPTYQIPFIGFRLAMAVPEPGTGLLVFAGLLGLASWRSRQR